MIEYDLIYSSKRFLKTIAKVRKNFELSIIFLEINQDLFCFSLDLQYLCTRI